jgi:hypothetical protein
MEVRDKHDRVVGHCAEVPEHTRYIMGVKPPPAPTCDSPMLVELERHAFRIGMRCQRGTWSDIECWPVVELRDGEDPSWLPGWTPAP